MVKHPGQGHLRVEEFTHAVEHVRGEGGVGAAILKAQVREIEHDVADGAHLGPREGSLHLR